MIWSGPFTRRWPLTRLDFIDEKRLLRQARRLLTDPEGKLRLWHLDRYKPHEGVRYEDRTSGDLLEEFYLTIAAEIDTLRAQKATLDGAGLSRLSKLEAMLTRGIDDEEDKAWRGSTTSGEDLLVEYWDYRMDNDLHPDLNLKAAPPRSEWDNED